MQNIIEFSLRNMTKTLGKALVLALLGLMAHSERTHAAAEQPVGKPPLTGVSPSCEPFSGRFIFTYYAFTDPEFTTAEATADVWLDGVLIGAAVAKYDSITQRGNGTLQMNGTHIITYNANAPMGEGTITTHDEIRLLGDKKNSG